MPELQRLFLALSYPILLPLLAVISPPLPAIDLETKVEALEARVEALTRRVQALESAIRDGTVQSPATDLPKGRPDWVLDDYTGVSPLRVLRSALNRDTGELELLLDVVSLIPDAGQWQDLTRGAPVPLAIDLKPPAAGQTSPTRLQLKRATSITPGSRIHVGVSLPPDQARLVRKVFVRHVAPSDAGQR